MINKYTYDSEKNGKLIVTSYMAAKFISGSTPQVAPQSQHLDYIMKRMA